METNVRTPLDIFHLPQHLVVPIFQRPYVWDEADQWAPLWQDIRRVAELRLADPYSQATHFLGAVVVQAQENAAGSLQPRNIIDGQQRITTLQLLMDASAAVLQDGGEENLAGQLGELTHNSTRHVQDDADLLKLRHTNRDREAFGEVMRADPPIEYEALVHRESLLARAHQYFLGQVSAWLGPLDHEDFGLRGRVLVDVVSRGLQLVAIDLRATENSQEIFETLNARGTPLTAADLIKNFVFQRLEAEGSDTAKAYAEDWPFEERFWEKEVSVGRYPITRGSLFLNQWLIARTGEEVGPKSTFNRFKAYVEHDSGQKMHELLRELKLQSGVYKVWVERAADPTAELNEVEMCVYRTQAAEMEAVKPILIWLHEPEAGYASKSVAGVVAWVESWLMRRMMLRLPSGDLGRVVADLISSHRGVADEELVDRISAFLSRLNATSTYWPGDAEVRSGLADLQAYRRFKRPRLRMLLEVAEDHARGYTGSGRYASERVPRKNFPIEHLLPQRWQDHWDVASPVEATTRDEYVHRIGNLTLLTTGLNSSVSNGPWLGEGGKRSKLHEHDVFLMNRWIRDESSDGWDEKLIDRRTERVCDALLATWPVPSGHAGVVVDRVRDSAEVTIRELINAGLIPVGTQLKSRPGVWGDRIATVRPDGSLELDGQVFRSPSAAGHSLRGGATNGWWFWELPDGRRLKDVRSEYVGASAATIDGEAVKVDLLSAIESLGHGWFEYGLVERAYADAHPREFAAMVARWGHTAIAPKQYTATAYLGYTLGRLASDGQLHYRTSAGTGRWAYNPDTSFWTLDAGADWAARTTWMSVVGDDTSQAREADAECRRYVNFSG